MIGFLRRLRPISGNWTGADILPSRIPVYATAAGTVSAVEEKRGWSGSLIHDEELDIISTWRIVVTSGKSRWVWDHVKTPMVTVGQLVCKGDLIGELI